MFLRQDLLEIAGSSMSDPTYTDGFEDLLSDLDCSGDYLSCS